MLLLQSAQSSGELFILASLKGLLLAGNRR